MQLPENALQTLTPHADPPPEFTPGDTTARADQISDPLLRRSYLWATAMNTTLIHAGDWGLQKLVHVSSGFVHIGPTLSFENVTHSQKGGVTVGKHEQRMEQILQEGGFAFGGYLLGQPKQGQTAPGRVSFIEIAQVMFPVVTVFGRIEMHGAPPHPHTGTGTCWVETAASGSTWTKAILTCRHTVSHLPLGSVVNLHASRAHSSPATGVLVEYNECTVDAAFVEVSASSWPTGLSPFGVSRPLAPGSKVTFTGRSSGPNSGSVLRVFQYGAYIGNLFGQRVIADCLGTSGDSGSLLETTSGDGAGIYIGTIPDGSGGHDGIYQDLAQVKDFFSLTLLK